MFSGSRAAQSLQPKAPGALIMSGAAHCSLPFANRHDDFIIQRNSVHEKSANLGSIPRFFKLRIKTAKRNSPCFHRVAGKNRGYFPLS